MTAAENRCGVQTAELKIRLSVPKKRDVRATENISLTPTAVVLLHVFKHFSDGKLRTGLF